MNLIHDPWISIRRYDGTQERITPWQITAEHDSNPVMAVNSPRPDFDGALMQFCIGLLQTAISVETEEDWEDWFYEPPLPEQLREQFEAVADAFELDGDGPRFMQDLELREGEPKEIASMLIEAPGDKSLRDNIDHFIKRGQVVGMCPACAAISLFTLQTNAPSGGVGHRTSLRGGGPLTTLVMCDPRQTQDKVGATLWRNVWLNVLENNEFLRLCGNSAKKSPQDLFPWLAPTHTSEKGKQDTTPDDVHPAQMYWGMPRRIRLDFANTAPGFCHVCGDRSSSLLSHYITKNYGVNYTGPWLHPLTPHSFDKQGSPAPRHAQPGGVSYRHWIGLIQADDEGSRKPAHIVYVFNSRRNHGLRMQFRVWAFGYDMDNMKARCWYEAQIPLYEIEEASRKEFEATVSKMVQAADMVRVYLVGAIKTAWFEAGDSRRNKDLSFVGQAFWQDTENDFYECLTALYDSLKAEEDTYTARSHVKHQWHSVLCKQALILFNQWANSEAIAYTNPRRISMAHNQLCRNLYGRKLCATILELPKTLQPEGAFNDAASVSVGQ